MSSAAAGWLRLISLLLACATVWLTAAVVRAQETPPPQNAQNQTTATAEVEPRVATTAEAPAAPPPQQYAVDLSSPRATMTTFLRAMQPLARGENNPSARDAALATLSTRAQDGDEIREDDEARRTRLRPAAIALHQAMGKLGEVDPLDLPDEADVLAGSLSRYMFFPGRPEQRWVWDELKPFGKWPQGRIVLVREPDGWRFSPTTVSDAPALAESLEPLPPRDLAVFQPEDEPVFATLGPTFALTRWWQWLSLLGCIFAGLLVGKLLNSLLHRAAARLERRGWRGRSVFFDSLASPLNVAALAAGLTVGLRLFIYMEEEVALLAEQVLQFLFLIAAGWALYNLVDVVDVSVRRFRFGGGDAKLDQVIVPLIRRTLRVFIVVVFFLVVAQNVFGLNITGWLAGLGIAGLAVSLAAQDSVKNLFGSLTVFFDRPFMVGDFVDFGGTKGTVEEIGFRSTRLRLVSGAMVTVPNMKWIDNTVENIGARTSIRREMNIGITYDTAPEKIEEAVRIVREVLTEPEVVEAGGYDLEKQAPVVAFNDMKADSLNIFAYYWYQLTPEPKRDYNGWLAHCQMVNLRIFRRFAEAGIEFAFPTQTLYLASDTKRELAVGVHADGGGLGGPDRAPA